MAFPTGIVTLVFTDIQGSSELWKRHGSTFQPVLEEHNRLLQEAFLRWEGVEVQRIGDGFFLVFAHASAAVRFVVEAQTALGAHDWGAPGGPGARPRADRDAQQSEPLTCTVVRGMLPGPDSHCASLPVGQLGFSRMQVRRVASCRSARGRRGYNPAGRYSQPLRRLSGRN